MTCSSGVLVSISNVADLLSNGSRAVSSRLTSNTQEMTAGAQQARFGFGPPNDLHKRVAQHGVGPLDGYSALAWDRSLRQRLRLYQLSYALEHLWWMEGFAGEPGVARVQQRIRALLADDSIAMPVMPRPAERL